jgi:putative solute:sodium symporter small subunit
MPRRSPMDRSAMSADENRRALGAYWKRNLRFTLILLVVWFLAGYVLSILLAPTLNRITFLGGPFGYWFAQNGAIYVFWLLIFVYAVGMNRLDREFDVEE